MADIVRLDTNDGELERLVLNAQLSEGDFMFANGQHTNNHLDMGYDEVSPDVREIIVPRLGQLVVVSDSCPMFIAPVPNGADGWAEDLAVDLGKASVAPKILYAHKLGRRKFENTPIINRQIARWRDDGVDPRGMVIDDVSSDGGTGEAMADFLTEQGLEIDLVVSILYRGDIANLSSRYRRAILIARQIPYFMDWAIFRSSGEIRSELDYN